MKIFSWNIRGSGSSRKGELSKRQFVKRIRILWYCRKLSDRRSLGALLEVLGDLSSRNGYYYRQLALQAGY